MSVPKYIGLYADRDFKTPLPRKWIEGEIAWYVNFGHLDAGHEKTYALFLENQSDGLIEDLEITAYPVKTTDGVTKTGVEIMVLDGSAARLESGAVHEFHVRWTISKESKAGKCQVAFDIKGWITEE